MCVAVYVISMGVVDMHVLHACVYVCVWGAVRVYENTETRDACFVLSLPSLFLCNRIPFSEPGAMPLVSKPQGMQSHFTSPQSHAFTTLQAVR